MNLSKSILLVEDDDFKRRRVLRLIGDHAPAAEVLCAASVSSAVRSLSQGEFDLIILDISLPSHDADGGAPAMSLPSGGLEVLLELSFESRGDPVVVLTQYPLIEYEDRSIPVLDARRAFKRDMDINLLEVIQYTRLDDSWADKLLEYI